MKTRLITVGGFLGAGKTTLMWETAKRLTARGMRVGLITNDQAPELVDTALLSRNGARVAEVSGSCFCCNFDGLLAAMSKVHAEADADVILAEPVGSCTDLSATIIQPLKEHHGHELVIAPLSVLVDPVRLSDILDGGMADMHPSAAYIFRKQIEEADIIVISKTDLLTADEVEVLKTRLCKAYPKAAIFTVSVHTGEGLDAWLAGIALSSNAGQHLAEVDYDIYAEGEAVLGWLNATIALRGDSTDWNAFAEDFLKALSQRLDSIGASVGHVKLILEAGDGFLLGNLTGKGESLSIRGSVACLSESQLTLNARVQMSPEALESVVRDVIDLNCRDLITTTPRAWRCLSPGRPKPTHRYDQVVKV